MTTRASFYLLLVFFCLGANAPTEAPPFWKKPEVYRRIEEERYIAVSARTEKLTQGSQELQNFEIVTAGQIAAPSRFTYEELIKFENYTKVISNFKELKYDPKAKTLFVHGEALSFHAMMHMNLEFTGDDLDRKILWRVVSGNFEGMKGEIRLVATGNNKTEISMKGSFNAETLPLPRVLMGVGLEIVGHRVAGLMRSHIEDQFKQLTNRSSSP